MEEQAARDTRHLPIVPADLLPPKPATSPVSDQLPGMIEFGVVGTSAAIQVQVHEVMTIGRADPQRGVRPDVDLGSHDGQTKGVSRRHAVILAKEDRLSVKDVGSVNGTRLNGLLLVAEQEYRLRHDDVLDLGDLKLQVRFLSVAADAAAPAPNSALAPVPEGGKGQHILILEDDEDVSDVFSIALQHAGYRVTTTTSVVSALGFVTHQRPDAIILDLLLPDMSGLEVLRFVRTEYAERRVPVIVVSGIMGGIEMKQANDAGADLCLGKPVGVEDLVRAVSTFLSETAKVDNGLVKPAP